MVLMALLCVDQRVWCGVHGKATRGALWVVQPCAVRCALCNVCGTAMCGTATHCVVCMLKPCVVQCVWCSHEWCSLYGVACVVQPCITQSLWCSVQGAAVHGAACVVQLCVVQPHVVQCALLLQGCLTPAEHCCNSLYLHLCWSSTALSLALAQAQPST